MKTLSTFFIDNGMEYFKKSSSMTLDYSKKIACTLHSLLSVLLNFLSYQPYFNVHNCFNMGCRSQGAVPS